MKYLFKDYPRELAQQIINDESTKIYYTLKEMESLINLFEWVEQTKEQYPSFCFYPEDFTVDVLFRACKNIKDEIHCDQITNGINITGFGYTDKMVINSLLGNRIITSRMITSIDKTILITDLFYSEFYFSNEEDRNKWVINNTEED